MPLDLSVPDRTALVCRSAMRHCARLGWAPVLEVPIPCGRRLDIMALTPEGQLNAIEVKSGPRDFLSDAKWPEYLEWCDRLFFATPAGVPADIFPEDAGLIVADGYGGAILREAPDHRLAAATRRAMTLRFAQVAARRIQQLIDPQLPDMGGF